MRSIRKKFQELKKVFSAMLCLLMSVAFFSCDTGGSNDAMDEGDAVQVIGRGYDVANGNFADAEELKEPVLDIEKIKAQVRVEKLDKSEFITVEGTNLKAYSNNLSVAVNVEGYYGGFSGALKTNFNLAQSGLAQQSFATVKATIKKLNCQIPSTVTVADLKKCLTEEASVFINDTTKTPEEVFNNFGTHVIAGIIAGARLDYNVQANMSQVDQSRNIGVYAQVSYKQIDKGISVDADVQKSDTFQTFQSSKSETLKTYGGDSEQGQKILSGNYDNWIDSIKGGNITFCDFSGQRPLIGIWEFANTDARKKELADAFKTLCEKNAKDLDALSETDAIVPIARIYEHGVRQGRCHEITNKNINSGEVRYSNLDSLSVKDSITDTFNFNDQVSSLWVGNAFVLTFYKDSNYSGELRQYVGQVDNMGSFNDWASSLIITEGSSTPVLEVYTDADYKGTKIEYYSTCDVVNLGSINDEISSVKIFNTGVYKVTVFKDGNLQGESMEITADRNNLKGTGLNDAISSIKIERK